MGNGCSGVKKSNVDKKSHPQGVVSVHNSKVNNNVGSNNQKVEQKPISTNYLLNETSKNKFEDIVYQSRKQERLGQSNKQSRNILSGEYNNLFYSKNNVQNKDNNSIVNNLQQNILDSSKNVTNNLIGNSKDLLNSQKTPYFTSNLPANSNFDNKPNLDWAKEISDQNFHINLQTAVIPSIFVNIS